MINNLMEKMKAPFRVYIFIIFYVLFVILLIAGFIFFIINMGHKQDALLKSLDSSNQYIEKTQNDLSELDKKNIACEQAMNDIQLKRDKCLEYSASVKKSRQDLVDKVKKFQTAFFQEKQKNIKLQKELNGLRQTGKKIEQLNSQINRLDIDKETLANKVSDLEIKLNKERSIYHYNLGVVYGKANMTADAITAFGKSLELEANNPEAYYNLGVLYSLTEPEKAITFFRKYLATLPYAADKLEVEDKINKLVVKLSKGFTLSDKK